MHSVGVLCINECVRRHAQVMELLCTHECMRRHVHDARYVAVQTRVDKIVACLEAAIRLPHN